MASESSSTSISTSASSPSAAQSSSSDDTKQRIRDKAIWDFLTRSDFIKPTSSIFAVVMRSPGQPPYVVDECGGCVMVRGSDAKTDTETDTETETDPNVYACALSWKESTLTALIPELKIKTCTTFSDHRVMRLNVRGTEIKGRTHLYTVLIYGDRSGRMELWWLTPDHVLVLGDHSYFTVKTSAGNIHACVTERLSNAKFDVFVDELGC